MLVVCGGREFPQRDHAAGLTARANEQAGFTRRAGHGHALRRQALHAARVPAAVGAARECAERDTFRDQPGRLSRRTAVANALQILGHLSREHFQIAGAEQARSRPGVTHHAERDGAPRFVGGSTIGLRVRTIERDVVEALGEDEGVGHEVAGAADEAVRRVVTALARVGIRARHAIEGARAGQRRGRSRQRLATRRCRPGATAGRRGSADCANRCRPGSAGRAPRPSTCPRGRHW